MSLGKSELNGVSTANIMQEVFQYGNATNLFNPLIVRPLPGVSDAIGTKSGVVKIVNADAGLGDTAVSLTDATNLAAVTPGTKTTTAPVLVEGQNFGYNELAGYTAGQNIDAQLKQLLRNTGRFWAVQYDKAIQSVLWGIADSLDATAAITSTRAFTEPTVYDRLVEIASQGAPDRANEYTVAVVDNDVYQLVLKASGNALQYSNNRVENITLGTSAVQFGQFTVFTMPRPTGQATLNNISAILMKPGSIGFAAGTSSGSYTPLEIDRKPELGLGEDRLITRSIYTVAPIGVNFGGSIAANAGGIARSVLQAPASWTLSFDTDIVPFHIGKKA